MKTNIVLARQVAAFSILPVVLAACGGGGSSADSSSPAVTPTATSLSIGGTAATGAAIVGGAVEVKCAAGTGSTTTIADGSYTVTISGGSLPCVLKVTTGSADLYSLAEDNGGSVVRANITPFTQLIAAQVVGGNLTNVYESFGGTTAQTVFTAGKVASAISAVTAALSGTVDLSGVNPLTATFVVGDTFDQQLDTFKAAIDTAHLTLADVTNTLVSGTTTSVSTILKPAVASSCAGLVSGRYRAINPNETDAQWRNHVFTLDAATLTITFFDGSTGTLADLGGCSFSTDAGKTQLLVSKSGITIGRSTDNTAAQPEGGLILPEQTIALSELAGTWNAMGYARDSDAALLHPTAATYTLDAAGKFSAGSDCSGIAACTAWTSTPGDIKASSDGGFEFLDADGLTHRLFAFRAADGSLTLYRLRPGLAGFSVSAKQQALSLPVVGAANSVWDFTINSSGYVSTITDLATTVIAVDATTQSYTRKRPSDGRIDGFTINKPRDGMRYRAAGTSLIDSGATVTFSEIVQMPLPGTGIGVYTSVASNQNFFGISINKP